MLEAAVAAAVRSGVSGGLDAVRMDQVILDAGVPRAAAYELWRAKGPLTSQDNLRRHTLLSIIRDMPAQNIKSTQDYAFQVLEELADQFDDSSPESLLRVRREMTRRVTAFNFETLQSQRWRIYRTISSSVGTIEDEELREAVRHGEETLLRGYGEMIDALRVWFKLELRDGFHLDDFVVCVFALVDGLGNRLGENYQDQVRIIDGQEWTLLTIGFDAMIDRFFTGTVGS